MVNPNPGKPKFESNGIFLSEISLKSLEVMSISRDKSSRLLPFILVSTFKPSSSLIASLINSVGFSKACSKVKLFILLTRLSKVSVRSSGLTNSFSVRSSGLPNSFKAFSNATLISSEVRFSSKLSS